MRLVFAGTPSVAVSTLHALVEAGHEIALVITRPDAPQGRKRMMTASPVADAAAQLGLDVLKTARLDDDATAQIAALDAELGVIVAYGGLVKEPLLSHPTHGWINLHFSLLPLWRGAAPVQRSMMAGDAKTGICVFQLVEALDAGDIYASVEVDTPVDATAGEFLDELAVAGAPVVVDVVAQIDARTAIATPQAGTPSIAAKLSREDGRIDFDREASAVYAHIRGVTPEPGAFTTIDGQAFKIHRVERSGTALRPEPGEIVADGGTVVIGTSTAPLTLVQVQPAGKPAMAAQDWWRGQRAESVKANS